MRIIFIVYDSSVCVYYYYIMCGALLGANCDFGSHDIRDKVVAKFHRFHKINYKNIYKCFGEYTY